MRTSLTTSGLRVGDKVAAGSKQEGYEVRFVEAQQGRMQIADTRGRMHFYHQDEIVQVTRAA